MRYAIGDTLRRETGQTTVEYALITVLVIAFTVVVFAVLQSSAMIFVSNLVNRLGALAAGT
jgi:Flp pilus assembly pilin Flp